MYYSLRYSYCNQQLYIQHCFTFELFLLMNVKKKEGAAQLRKINKKLLLVVGFKCHM